MSGSSKRRWVWLWVAAALCVQAPAWADAYDAALRRAVAQKERALDHNTPDQWESALRLFIAADRLRETKECKFELGYAAEQMQQHDIALGAYEAALRLGLEGGASSHAEAFVHAQASALGRIDVRGEDGVEVWVAGYQRGILPLSRPVPVFPGKGAVQVVTPKGTTRVPFEVAAGDTAVVDAAPPKPSAPPAPVVDASETPEAPPPRSSHVAPPPDAPSGNPYTVLGWSLAAGGAVVAGVGVTFAVVAPGMIQQGRDDLDEYCAVRQGTDACQIANPGQITQAQDAVNSIATWKGVETAAWVGVGVGAAALTTGVLLLLLPGQSGGAPSAFLLPQIGPGSVGLVGTARF